MIHDSKSTKDDTRGNRFFSVEEVLNPQVDLPMRGLESKVDLLRRGAAVSLSRVEVGRSKAHIQMSYHFANPIKEVEEVYL